MANRTICDFTPEGGGTFVSGGQSAQAADNVSAHYRFARNTFTWDGAATETWQQGTAGAARLVKKVIIGSRGESAPFELRYFEMGGGGASEPARHPLEHVVIGVRGKGVAVVGERTVELNPLDVLYIAPNELHQVSNRDEQPFGFFCIVAAERESLAEVLQDELDWLQGAAQAGVRK